MTRDEAIKVLRQLKGLFRNERIGEVADMAIDALLGKEYGKWEQTEEEKWLVFRCSECGEEYLQPKGIAIEALYNFCPNCGAKMEKPAPPMGEVDDENVMSVDNEETDYG